MTAQERPVLDVRTQMLIRRPPAEVFAAFVDPAVTTRFWFTRSSGPVEVGADLVWTWEMYGVSNHVRVLDVEPERRIRVQWQNYDAPSTVEWTFEETALGTFVTIVESDLREQGEQLVAHAIDSTGGFTSVLAGLKALLEHGVELNLVGDQRLCGDHPR